MAFDAEEFGRGTALAVKAHVTLTIAPLVARIAELEKQVAVMAALATQRDKRDA